MAETEKGFKRINFFKGFLTTEKDWNDAERYHVEKRKLHNQMFHAPGIVPGFAGELRVSARDRADLSVEVSPGYAIDGTGQDILVWETQIKSINPADYKLPQTIYLVAKYVEQFTDFIAYKENLEYKGHRRIIEQSKLEWTIVEPSIETEVEVARVQLEEGARKITDAKNVLAPGPNEIDLRYVSWAGVSGAFINPLFSWRLRKVLQEMAEIYGFLHREKKVTTAGDTMHATNSMEMLVLAQQVDLRNVFPILQMPIDHQWLFVNEVESKIPAISQKKDFGQYKKNIEILKGLIEEKKRTLEFLDTLLQYQEKACEALRRLFAQEMKPAAKPAEVKPDAEPKKEKRVAGELSLDVGGAWDQVKVQSAPFEKNLVVEGITWSKVDEIDILDRKSEEEHEFAIREARDSYRTSQKLKYPDGVVVEDRGIAHEGGYAEWKIKNLTPGADLAIIRRMDYVYGEYEADLYIDGKKIGRTTCPGEDRKYRWRNWPWVVPGEFITAETIMVKQVNITADRDINMFHLYFYQAIG
ncbi:MAG: hypothetical protein FJ125_04180 [Deltaproteobacteria bacterium]|nr:hypothetical protein [Deltaproteobacteria bacterium]